MELLQLHVPSEACAKCHGKSGKGKSCVYFTRNVEPAEIWLEKTSEKQFRDFYTQEGEQIPPTAFVVVKIFCAREMVSTKRKGHVGLRS